MPKNVSASPKYKILTRQNNYLFNILLNVPKRKTRILSYWMTFLGLFERFEWYSLPFPPHSPKNSSYFNETTLNWLTSFSSMVLIRFSLISVNSFSRRLSKFASSIKLTQFHIYDILVCCAFILMENLNHAQKKIKIRLALKTGSCTIALHPELYFSKQETSELIVNSIFQ